MVNSVLTGVVCQLVVCEPNDVGAHAVEEILRKDPGLGFRVYPAQGLACEDTVNGLLIDQASNTTWCVPRA